VLDRPSQQLPVTDLGLLEYGAALAAQRQWHARVVAGESFGTILVTEHPPVLTFGYNADRRYLKFAEGMLKERGIATFDVERGGDVTAHEPGQLVVYPILNPSHWRLTPKSYVCLLEDVVIKTLCDFGVIGARDPEHPGVWVGAEKVCAVGVRIKNRVTLHGIALNVTNDLGLFDLIVPCGIAGRGVTSMAKLGVPAGFDAVKAALVGRLEREIRGRLLKELPQSADTPIVPATCRT